MIIGNGLIAKAFLALEQNKDILICAAGVSNSAEISNDEFHKEMTLIKKAINLNKKIIYFSTMSINQAKENYSPYICHKIEMEKLVKQSKKFIIYRVPQIVGNSNNSFTLLNFISQKIKARTYFTVWKDSFRSLIDVSDLFKVVNYSANLLPSNFDNKILNMYNHNLISVEEIVRIFEDLYGIKGDYDVIEKKENISYSNQSNLNLFQDAGVEFDNSYNLRVIHKYYEKK